MAEESTCTNTSCFEEKLAEEIRKYRVLYDKECKEFKDRNKKSKAWEQVAKEMSMSKEDVQASFRNMRNKYSREKKKLSKAKVSGAGQDDVTEVKKDLSEMYPYLQWLEPYIVERKSMSNFGEVTTETESNHDISDSESNTSVSVTEPRRSITPDAVASDSSIYTSQPELVQSRVTKAQKTSWKFRKQNNESKKKKPDCEETEREFIQSLAASIANESQDEEKQKDEDELFGTLIASQLRQLPPDKKILVKMQISNLIYQEMMNSIRGVSQYQMYPSNYQAETPGHPLHDPKNPYLTLP